MKIEAGQRRTELLHCSAYGEGPEVNSDKANAIDQTDNEPLSFAIVS